MIPQFSNLNALRNPIAPYRPISPAGGAPGMWGGQPPVASPVSPVGAYPVQPIAQPQPPILGGNPPGRVPMPGPVQQPGVSPNPAQPVQGFNPQMGQQNFNPQNLQQLMALRNMMGAF